MAFGKDDKNLQAVGGFRQQARQYQAARPRFGTGGGKPYFIDRFQPSLEDTDKIRILKGLYEVEIGQQDGSIVKQTLYYFPYIEHFHGTLKKGAICSAGPLGMFKGKGQPCLGHEIYWADKNAGRKNGPMSMTEKNAFTIIHYAPYAKVEQVDDQGQVKKNDKGEPYWNWVRVMPHQRHDPRFQGKEMRDFHILHWSLGFGHFKTLMEYDKEISRSCKSCGGRDTIVCEAWTCRYCGEALIEPATTTLTPKEIDEFTSKNVRCASCGNEGMLQEIISCTQCANPVRAEIFDVDINVKRVKSSEGGNMTNLIIPSWSNPCPIDQRYAEFAKPLPLDKIFQPTPYEKQQEMWGGGGSRMPVTNSQLSRPYGGGAPTLGPGGKPQY